MYRLLSEHPRITRCNRYSMCKQFLNIFATAARPSMMELVEGSRRLEQRRESRICVEMFQVLFRIFPASWYKVLTRKGMPKFWKLSRRWINLLGRRAFKNLHSLKPKVIHLSLINKSKNHPRVINLNMMRRERKCLDGKVLCLIDLLYSRKLGSKES